MFDFDIAFMYYFNLIGKLLWRFCSMLGAAASEISGGAGVTEVLQKVDISNVCVISVVILQDKQRLNNFIFVPQFNRLASIMIFESGLNYEMYMFSIG